MLPRSCRHRLLAQVFRRGRQARWLSTNTVPPVTPIEKIIMDGIKATGPISFASYMQMCLSHPTAGYYSNPQNQIFGTKGDFVTSPEISSLFGELLGIWFMSQWMQSAKTRPIRVVELGPGRGTLMHDILRVVSQFGKDRLASVHLVETSPTLRALQESRLAPSADKYGCTLEWHDAVEQIPPSADAYTMVVAHEFFDALPFHTIEKTEQGWQELLIALADSPSPPTVEASPPDDASTPSSSASPPPGPPYPRFRYVLSPQPTAASTLLGHSSPRFADLPLGARLEVSPASYKTARAVGALLAGSPTSSLGTKTTTSSTNGCALIVDYGAAHASSQSFRAFKSHSIVDVFTSPGACDLTANVDFAYLAEAVAGLVPAHPPLSQGTFLQRMGLHMRVEALTTQAKRTATAENKDEDGSDAIALRAAAHRLMDPKGMGREYTVLALGGHADARLDGGVWPFVEVPEPESQPAQA